MAQRSEQLGPPDQPEDSRALVAPPPGRRIVVSPGDVFQRDTRDVRLISLEAVVVRFMGVTAAILCLAIACGFCWLALG